jgi:hypothetical protein
MSLLADYVIDIPEFPLAKCKGITHDTLFFPRRDRTSHESARRAKDICTGKDGFGVCPHLVGCAAYALEHKIRHGIWGGMSERDRARVRRRAREEKLAKLSERRATPEVVIIIRTPRRRVYHGRTFDGSIAFAA